MSEKEKELFLLMQKGDHRAFLELYDTYDIPIYAFINTRVNNKHDVQDIFSTVWEKMILQAKHCRGEYGNSFRAWIFTITRNTIYDYYRSNVHRKNIVDLNEAIHVAQKGEQKDVYEEQKLFSSIKKLPEKQSEVIRLKYFQDLKNKEISVLLKQSEKTVASNLSRALQKLRKMMQ